MSKFVRLSGIAMLCALTLCWICFLPQKSEAEALHDKIFTLQMDEKTVCTIREYRYRIVDGALVQEDEKGETKILLFTDFDKPYMAVSQNALALFCYPETYYFLYSMDSGKEIKVDTSIPISGIKFSLKQQLLVFSDTSGCLMLYSKDGKRELKIESNWPICDGAISSDGRRIAVIMFSAEVTGYKSEIFSVKTGRLLSSAYFSQAGALTCHMGKRTLFLYCGNQPIGYIKRGKFQLFS